jgi:hypothetical protein
MAGGSNGYEPIPFDHFWEQPIREMNLKSSSQAFSMWKIGTSNGGVAMGYQPFCAIDNF